MNWFQLLTENASPVELLILAWISWRVETMIQHVKHLEVRQFNTETKANALWKVWGHLSVVPKEENRKP